MHSVPGIVSAKTYAIPFAGSFNGTNAFLSLTYGSPGDLTDWMIGYWYKRGSTGADMGLHTASVGCQNYFSSANKAVFADQGSLTTTATFTDTTNWHHRCLISDTTNGTATDRLRIYEDGVRITAFDSTLNPSASEASVWNTAILHNIGRTQHVSGQYYNGLLADFVFAEGSGHGVSELIADGSAVDPSGISFGTNSFWLDFADNGDLGKDVSGRGNHWTNTGSNVTQSTDTPTS